MNSLFNDLLQKALQCIGDLNAVVEKLKTTSPKTKMILVTRKDEDLTCFLQERLSPFESRIIESGNSIASAVKDIRRYRNTKVVIALEKIDDSDEGQINEALRVLSIKVIIEKVSVFALEDKRSSKTGFKVITPGV